MPLLKIQTNIPLDMDKQNALIRKASQAVAAMLGKPESYVMICCEQNSAMLFAGNSEPLAYLELKSIGLPDSKTKDFSSQLAELLNTETGIAPDRVYIEFADAPRAMWGWNGSTF